MNIPKEKCEQMLDAEAERVARSIIQLINSAHFEAQEGIPKEQVHVMNKLVHGYKTALIKEIMREFQIPGDSEGIALL